MGIKLLSTTRTVGDILPLSLQDGGELDSQVIDANSLPSGGGVGSTFVFRPGAVGPQPANVFTSWAALQLAYQAVSGSKWIQLDNTFGAITIPVGTWSLDDGTITPSNAAPQPGIVTMTWSAGAVFTSSHTTFESVKVVASATITTVGAGGDVIIKLDKLASIVGSGGEVSVPLIVKDGGTMTIQGYGGSILGDGSNNIVDALTTGIVSVELCNGSQALDHWLIGAGTASAFALADATSFASQVTDGALVPTFDQFVDGASFVFRPGGTAGGNVFVTWKALYSAAVLVTKGSITVLVDDSLAAAHITAGAYNFDNWTFLGEQGSASFTLHVDVGVTITSSSITIGNGLLLLNDATVTPWVPTTFFELTIEPTSAVQCSGAAAPFLAVTNAGASGGQLDMVLAASLGDGTHNVITVGAARTLFVVGSVTGAGVLAHAFAGLGTVSINRSADMPVSPVQDVTNLVFTGTTRVRTLTTGTFTAIFGEQVIFDTTGGAIDYQLEANPAQGDAHAFMWKAGTTPPTIDGNGKQVASWSALNQSSAGTQVINILGGNGRLQYDGTQWWWMS